ncbi:D-galactonate dehydratase family protein [Psychrosphaera sp. B3R10]|uniref:D-mannonate dehydratase ManD n=1 Tax=unclassified Psychrosphaera TaxID=2641570 RepID=UPI001C081725|nr:D-mannonate dehydratase ManD [Psychrosphaera sp. 1_MG-2023]MBU2883969.1 D-galactonate dehydratase family protein [Psychrosphaera sp. I2R16]MBU2990374.1 D-galactonate dehydratase family protein [Psychrosphaera sp. B3R10]MDO6718653.1 D-galactonate dehydratase family protein [Psychrosphaera sp. 1_MG-2023]
MKIIDAKVIVCSPGRNFVTLKIITDEGLYGVGDATLNGREKAVVSYLEDYVIPMLIGRDPQRIEDIWQYLYRGVYWRRGPIGMTAIAAVDTALWDIKAKAANMPLYQLLGGRSRDKIMVYTHANGLDLGSTLEQVGKAIDQGYKAVRVQSGIPGVAGTYGVSKNNKKYEPADSDLPTEDTWSTEKYLNYAPKLFAEVRKQFGDDIHLLHDVHHRLTPIEAARLGKELEPYHLFWMEDPVPAENQESFKLIRHHTTTPIAVGEVFNSIHDCRELIQNQLIDYIRTTVVHAGGISQLKRIADFASLFHVKTGCHGATDLSPICMAAALHFDYSVANFGIQEHMAHSEKMESVFTRDYRYVDGYFTPGEAIGHGADIDESIAKKYPYKRACLPVNRLEDGTLWNW